MYTTKPSSPQRQRQQCSSNTRDKGVLWRWHALCGCECWLQPVSMCSMREHCRENMSHCEHVSQPGPVKSAAQSQINPERPGSQVNARLAGRREHGNVVHRQMWPVRTHTIRSQTTVWLKSQVTLSGPWASLTHGQDAGDDVNSVDCSTTQQLNSVNTLCYCCRIHTKYFWPN